MQQRLRRIERRLGVNHRRQRLVVDLDQVEGVLGEITVGGDDDGHRLADIADLADSDGPTFDRRLDPDHQAGGGCRHVVGGQYGGHARRLARGVGADCHDAGMGMRRAQDGCLQRVGFGAEVVDETAAPGQQRGVFNALDRLAAPVRRDVSHASDIPRCALFGTFAGNAVTNGTGGRYRPVSRLTEKSHFTRWPPSPGAPHCGIRSD